MSESRGGESRNYSSYTTSYRNSCGSSRNYGELNNSTQSYQGNMGESRDSGESRGMRFPFKVSKPTAVKNSDIGDFRSQVMEELYDELYREIKQEVRQELQLEKSEIVREVKDELREKLKTDLIRNFSKGIGEER